MTNKHHKAIMTALILSAWFVPIESKGNHEIHLAVPSHFECGIVKVGGSITDHGSDLVIGMSWSWDDGSTESSWFPAIHQYEENGTFELEVTASYQSGITKTESIEVVIDNANEEGCFIIDKVYLEPPLLLLSPKNSESTQMEVIVFDKDGNQHLPDEVDIEFPDYASFSAIETALS
jgi:hypothetical protein